VPAEEACQEGDAGAGEGDAGQKRPRVFVTELGVTSGGAWVPPREAGGGGGEGEGGAGVFAVGSRGFEEEQRKTEEVAFLVGKFVDLFHDLRWQESETSEEAEARAMVWPTVIVTDSNG
jgi:hypothetical protein